MKSKETLEAEIEYVESVIKSEQLLLTRLHKRKEQLQIELKKKELSEK